MRNVLMVASAALLFAGCGDSPLLSDSGHSKMWNDLANVCPIRTDDVTGIHERCATLKGNRGATYNVMAVTTDNQYLVLNPETFDMNVATEDWLRQVLELDAGQSPEVFPAT